MGTVTYCCVCGETMEPDERTLSVPFVSRAVGVRDAVAQSWNAYMRLEVFGTVSDQRIDDLCNACLLRGLRDALDAEEKAGHITASNVQHGIIGSVVSVPMLSGSRRPYVVRSIKTDPFSEHPGGPGPYTLKATLLIERLAL